MKDEGIKVMAGELEELIGFWVNKQKNLFKNNHRPYPTRYNNPY